MIPITYYIDIVNKADAGEVAASFSWALMENREIKPLVIPELWPDIDRWMDNHEVFECPPSLASFILTDSTSTGVGGYDGLDEITYNYVNTIYCPTLRSPYSFEVLGIKLERVNGEWKITGWEEICEIRPGESNCAEMPTSYKPPPTPAAAGARSSPLRRGLPGPLWPPLSPIGMLSPPRHIRLPVTSPFLVV